MEHIPIEELKTIVKKIFLLCNDNSSFLHVVDFGYHSNIYPGFGKMYYTKKQEFNRGLNLARVNDIEKIFTTAGITNFEKFIYRSENVDIDLINKFWISKYSKDDLEAMVAIYVSTK